MFSSKIEPSLEKECEHASSIALLMSYRGLNHDFLRCSDKARFTAEMVIATAKKILEPYTLDIPEVDWSVPLSLEESWCFVLNDAAQVYRISHRSKGC